MKCICGKQCSFQACWCCHCTSSYQCTDRRFSYSVLLDRNSIASKYYANWFFIQMISSFLSSEGGLIEPTTGVGGKKVTQQINMNEILAITSSFCALYLKKDVRTNNTSPINDGSLTCPFATNVNRNYLETPKIKCHMSVTFIYYVCVLLSPKWNTEPLAALRLIDHISTGLQTENPIYQIMESREGRILSSQRNMLALSYWGCSL